MLSMNEIRSCFIEWNNGRSDTMDLGSGALAYVLTMHDNFRKPQFGFAGQTWHALGNHGGRSGIMLASSDLGRQIFVEAGSDKNEFISKAKTALRELLYALDGGVYVMPDPDSLVALG